MKKPVLKINQAGDASPYTLIISSVLTMLAIIGIDAWIRHHARPSGEAWPVAHFDGAGNPIEAPPTETKCVVSTTYPPTTTCEAPHDLAPTP